MNEKEKMISGEIYNPCEETLCKERNKAKTLCQEYNSLNPNETEKKKKKPTKEQLKAYEVFCNALNRGVNVDFDGIYCRKVGKDLFVANGKVYELKIENFLKVLRGE